MKRPKLPSRLADWRAELQEARAALIRLDNARGQAVQRVNRAEEAIRADEERERRMKVEN